MKKTKQQISFRYLLLWMCVLSVSYAMCAPPASELYTAAAALYKQSQFEKAAATYEKIIMQGYRSPEVYYNLGNCYYKLNHTGKAILNFERAKKLAPDDEDILHNLQLAQLKTVDRLTPVPQLALFSAWNNFVSTQSSKGWGLAALACLWMALLVFALHYFLLKKRWLSVMASLLFIFSLAFLSLAYQQSKAELSADTGVLLVENTSIKSAPDANGTDLFTIHEGLCFAIVDEVGNWYKIRLADGKIGWIEKGLFETV